MEEAHMSGGIPADDGRREFLTRGTGPADLQLAAGVGVRALATGRLGAQRLTTSLALFEPGATLPYHTHPFSEVIVLLRGDACVLVEGRRYALGRYDALHVPEGTAHSVVNGRSGQTVFHTSMASQEPTRVAVNAHFETVDCQFAAAGVPEALTRFDAAAVYELGARTAFRDLFAGRLGSRGICGGYGLFQPGASLPCHYHDYDESITIVEGEAVCQAAGAEYLLANNDTACIPKGRPHRFINRGSSPMAMIWVYAGDEPDRVIVNSSFCEPCARL
jgi:quercetin dioxygenase-like cupin family protein